VAVASAGPYTKLQITCTSLQTDNGTSNVSWKRPLNRCLSCNNEQQSSVLNSARLKQSFSALTLLVGRLEENPACKKWERWWRWALVSPDGVAPSRMVCVSASVNLPLHHKSRSSLLAPAHPGGLGERAVKWLWW